MSTLNSACVYSNGYCSIEFEGSEDCIYGIETGLRNLRAMLERI